jgi:hypothetical protein
MFSGGSSDIAFHIVGDTKLSNLVKRNILPWNTSDCSFLQELSPSPVTLDDATAVATDDTTEESTTTTSGDSVGDLEDTELPVMLEDTELPVMLGLKTIVMILLLIVISGGSKSMSMTTIFCGRVNGVGG